MDPRRIITVARHHPFRRFVIELGSGTKVEIRHPEAIRWVGDPEGDGDETKSQVAFIAQEPDGEIFFFFHDQVSALRFPPRGNGNSRARRPHRNG